MRSALQLRLLLLLSTAEQLHGSAVRGARPELADAYDALGEHFQCLDGAQVLPSYAQLNDDYCDCEDGSDEPGTSACSGVASSRSVGFYCPNLGYEGSVIPPSRVNDGICDCCDGGDEWGGTTCANRCASLAAGANERNAIRAAVVRQGMAARVALEAVGASTREELEAELAQLKARADVSKPGLEQLKERYDRWEAAEQGRAAVEAAAVRRPRGGGSTEGAEGGAVAMREWASSMGCTQDFDCPVTQSSFNWLGEAYKAVDGNDSADYDKDLSCVHTDNAEGSPSWWQIDLGAEVAVDHITIQNRRDPNAARLDGARVFVGGGLCEGYVDGDEPGGRCAMSGRVACGDDSSKYKGIAGAADSTVHTLPCDDATGQFVTVSLAGGSSKGQWLSFCEIEVWGTRVPDAQAGAATENESDAPDAMSLTDVAAAAAAAALAKCSDRPASAEADGQNDQLGDHLEEPAAPGHRRLCPPHLEQEQAYRFLVDGTNAISSCAAQREPVACGTVCALQCLPGYTASNSYDDEIHEVLVCDSDGLWQRLHTFDERGTPRGLWSCQLDPPPTPTVLSIRPSNESLDVEVVCGADSGGSGGGTHFTVSAEPSQCTADGYCFGAAVTQRFDSMTHSCQLAHQQQQQQEGSSAPLRVAKLTVTGLTNEAPYSLSVKAQNAGGAASARSRTRAIPTTLPDEYATASAEHTALQAAYEEKLEQFEQNVALFSDAQRGLQDTCVEHVSGKYTYRVCLFKSCEQKETSGYSWTSLGNWDATATEADAEEEAGNGAGAEAEEEGEDEQEVALRTGVLVLRFTGGERCWNGPLRSTRVVLECGADAEILSISEPETCSYELKLATPAVCTEAVIPPTYPNDQERQEL